MIFSEIGPEEELGLSGISSIRSPPKLGHASSVQYPNFGALEVNPNFGGLKKIKMT